jgi:leucyl-tRNA synthetase
MGCKIDHRRSFITTPVNPFYDLFVKWQFRKLNSLGLCKFGKRFVVWSPLDNQPCADHDRASGEGVQPQEYTIIKLPVRRPYPPVFDKLGEKNVYLAAATLRPETMYGQTNCWVLPDGDYGAFEIAENEVIVCAERAARNLAFQGHSMEYGKIRCLGEFKGNDLIGLALSAPFGLRYDIIYTLPMMTILMDKGTGVVTSVPSDSPADWRTLQDLKEKPDLRKKFGVADEWVLPYEAVPILDVEGYGSLCAQKVCQEMKIKSQNDPELEEAKNVCYRLGFNKGIMIVGEYTSQPVNVARTKICDDLIRASLAMKYAEPADEVISRSGDSCVVALSDQWYLPYGEGEWLEKAKAALEKMNMFGELKATRKAFEEALDWLHEWAFSRTYGLGTRVPWDEQFLVESLSDSTIYMAYYTISHILQGGSIDGTGVSDLPISPQLINDSFFDYVFGMSEIIPDGLPVDVMKKMRREFEFWYPYDVRVSGKDLIKNHLTFAIYNHVALFPSHLWPKGVRANGFLLLNGSKMSKSSGNFLTLREAVEKYSADAMRMALAESGDNLENSNFTHGSANGSILRLYKFVEFFREIFGHLPQNRKGEMTPRDRVCLARIDEAITKATAAYDAMNYRDALIATVYDLKSDVDGYVSATAELGGVHAEVMQRYMEVQLVLIEPIAPHTSQYLWREVLKKEGFLCDAKWPTVSGLVDVKITLAEDKWLQAVLSEIRIKIGLELKTAAKKMKGELKCEKIALFIGEHPLWYGEAQKLLNNRFDKHTKTFPPFNEITAEIKGMECLRGDKKALPLCIKLIKDTITKVDTEGEDALCLGLPFLEENVLSQNVEYMKTVLSVKEVMIHNEVEAKDIQGLAPRRILTCHGRPMTVSVYVSSQ